MSSVTRTKNPAGTQVLALTLIFVSFLLSGCGVTDAIDSANSIPAKLDETNKKMVETNGKLDETIAKMKSIGELAELQVVETCYKVLNDAQFGKDLVPLPFDLMACAEKLGEHIATRDAVKIIYLWVKKLNEVGIGKEDPTAEEVAAFDHDKNRVFTAAEAFCGLLPEAKVMTIIDEQIYAGGRFQDSAMHLLMLRSLFLRVHMLKNSLFSSPMDSVGILEEAVKYAGYIDTIARLPFAREISIKITGFVKQEPIVETFDPAVAMSIWKTIRTKAKNGLGEIQSKSTGSPEKDQKARADQIERRDKALATVNKQIDGWTVQPAASASLK